MSKTKKIIYLTTTRLPTEKAHGLATMKICEAFADLGYAVEVIAPRLWNRQGGDPYEYYGVKKNFKILKIACLDFVPLHFAEKPAFILQSISFSIVAFFYLLFRYGKNIQEQIFFSHDYIPLYLITFLSTKVFYDIHHFPGKNFIYHRLMKKSFGFAVQTKWKIKELNNKFNISSQKIVYWPNGTDVDKFVISETSNEVRKLLALPLNKKIILYTGQLFDWKGTDTLIKAVKYLSEESVIYLVGGTTTDIVNCKRNIIEANDSKIIFVPFVVHSQVPRWLKSADVLVLPNTGRQKVSLYYTSPMKLFEYMASGRPIVASSIPSILEILNNQNAFLIQPDDPVKLASMIKKVFSEQQLAEKIAHQAQNDVQKYTWQSRAQRIIDYFSLHA